MPEEKNKDNFVRVPQFFSITRNGKVSYLLGTHHGLLLSELPKQVLDIIETCKTFVTEKRDEAEDGINFFSKAILRNSTTEPWVNKLSLEVKEFIEKVVGLGLKRCVPDAPEWHHKLDDLELWAAYFFACQGAITLLYGQKGSEIELIEPRDLDEDKICMDFELMNIFESKNIYGLEGWMDGIPARKVKANNINIFNELYEERV